jgi:hypothetical protein
MDESGAIGFDQPDKIIEQKLTRTALENRYVRSVHFRLDRMHDHVGVHVVHPEVLVATISQTANYRQGLLPSLVLREFSLRCQRMKMG